MIDYHTFHQINYLSSHQKLSISQIARQLNLSVPTVYKYLKKSALKDENQRNANVSLMDIFPASKTC